MWKNPSASMLKMRTLFSTTKPEHFNPYLSLVRVCNADVFIFPILYRSLIPIFFTFTGMKPQYFNNAATLTHFYLRESSP